MRNLVASSIRRWRLPLAPNLASADGASEQIVATCYDAESRVTYAVTDACNLYGVRDSAREGDDAELCLEMCLVESVPSATDAFDTRDVADDAVGNDARAGVDGDEKDDERNHLASPRTDEASEAPSNPNEPPLALVGEGPEDGPASSEVSAYQPALREASPIVGAAFVDDLRGVCVACATGELLLVAPDPEDDDEGMAPGAILTKDMAPECVGRVAQGLRAMRWNPDGELLVLATWAGTLILMTKEFRVLAEAPVGGGGGDGVASLSWRGDGQFLASLVAVRGGEPQLRVWEREDLTFHATGESLRPARISAGDPRGNCPSGDTFESSSGKTEKLTLSHAPPLAWQPRGALVAVACAPQRAREDSDVDSTSASDALDEEARVSRRDAKNTEKNDKKRPPPLPATEAEIVFFERNGLRRGSFRLPARGAGVEVTSLAWSCDSERLAVCVADPEAAVFEKKSRSGSGEDGDDFRGDFGAATQIWRRGNGKWYLSREVRFSTREGPKVYCAWDLSNPDVLRIATPNGRVEEHVFADEISVSSAATTATIDGADVLVTPMARAVIPPPMCAATVAFPATVADVCFCPASAVRTSFAAIDAPDAAFSEGQNRFAPRGEAVLALLSDGRLAIASAHRLTEWEETVELLADEDDELEYGKETSHLHHGPDADVLLKLEAGVVRPVGGVFSILERAEDVPRRVAWLDANTALVAADRPSDGSASLLMVKLSFREAWDDDDDLTSPRRAGSGNMSSRLAEPRWSCEVVSVTDLPLSANAIARAEGENPAGAFVQMQTRCVDASPSASNDRSHAPTSLFASVAEDEHGDPTLSAVETSWPSASLPRACVALVALPPAKRGAPPTLAGLDARGVLRCGEHVVARDVRSFAAHFGDIGDDTLPFSSKAAEKKEARDVADAALASASAYAKRWRAWSADDASPSLTRPEARLVYATNSDELRVVELAEVFGEASENGSDPLAATDGGGDFSGVFPSAENTSNAFAAAAGGTRGFSIERDSRGDSRGVSSVRQNDRMHVSMRAAMRPADADRGIDSRTRRIEAGARIVAAPPGGVDVVLQMPRGNLETVAPRFLVLPAVARALDERRFAAAAAVATRHRVDLNLIVDRGWPRFLRHADAFVRDVDDPDVVAELLESLDAGDCTAPGKPYARLAPPTEAGDVSDVFGVDGESLAANGDEARAQAEDEDEATRPNGLLTSPSVDLVAVARSALADDARASASSRRPTNEGGNSRNSRELASGSSPGTDPDFVSAADEAAAKARRDDPRGKIRLTCSAIARAVARVAAEKAREASSRAASSPAPRRGDESRETKGEAFSSRVAYTVVEPAEELGFPEPPPRVAVDASMSPPVAVSVARFEGMAVASATERADRADPSDAGGEGARDDTVVETLSRRLHETTKLSHVSDTSAAFLSPSPPPPTSSDSPLHESAEDVDIDHASMRMDVDALLPDRWELVMLSAHARSVPPDLEGALSRVRRRREAEIENARDAEASRDASVVSGTRTEAAKNARLANAIDRVSSMNSDVDSEAALDHLLALEGGKNLFDAAMGTYDLSTAFLVGQRAPGMDPGEYVPELERLQALPLSLRKADVDVRLGRWRSAVENLLKGGDAERACALAAKRRLFPHAMAVAMEREREEEMSLQANKEDEKDDMQKVSSVSGLGGAGGLRGRRVGNSTTAPRSTTVSPLRVAVATAYAGQLNEERRHEDAAVALLSVGDLNGAMKAYADGLNWRPALALAGRLQLPLSERRLLASELTDALEQFDPAGAAAVAERELGDVDRAASLLCAAKKWRETVSVAYAHGRGDLVETVVAPAAAEAASGVVSSAREAPARAEKYLERLRKLRERREALERALGADAGTAAAAAGGAVGRPGATRDDDDDGASSVFSAAASVSTLASGVSGFSAYTDRTLGAATATTNQTGTSLSASTVGGRVGKKKPTRAERRGKKAGAGLRAGGPTEERDLANHLASGGVAGDLLAPGALEHVGELSELLVVLGHAEDAATLQGAVSAAIAAHHKASAEARRALDALDAKDAKDGLLSEQLVSANAANTNALANNSTGRKIVPCPCAACVAHRSTHCLAAKNAQWKWAALRDAPLPKKKKATVWDDVAETAKEL